MELSVESSCQYVTWKVRDFFELPLEIGYSLDSPEFRFAGDRYLLRLYPNGNRMYKDGLQPELKVVRLISTFPQRSVSCKVGYRWRDEKSEIDVYWSTLGNEPFLPRSVLQDDRDKYVPDGTFTALCSMRLKELSRAGSQQPEEVKTSDKKEKQKSLSEESVFFSSRSWSFKMELSIESPCQNVSWKVPDFFQLLSKTGYCLNSPEFSFAGDRYCLRFYPQGNKNGDTVDTDLQIVRLTSTFPERIVLYKLGYKCGTGEDEYDSYEYSDTLIRGFGICPTRSEFVEDLKEFVPDGTLTVLCCMRLKEQSSALTPQSEEAGNFHAEEKQEELPDDALLRERMKELLTKNSDYDVTICVRDKEFRAHRNILRVRSPVFAMMLPHDTKENNTATIKIEDCDPDSFDEFLLYVYSGRTEKLSTSNALHLYYTADKYDFPLLKERCVSFLKASLSVESICDVVLLAAKHQEKELLEIAIEFFARNIKKIIVTVGWQKFMVQNPVEANELYIKSMEILLPGN